MLPSNVRVPLPPLFPVAILSLALLLGGCLEAATAPNPVGFTGQWCTEGTIGNNDQPIRGLAYLALTMGQDGASLFGSGVVKREESDRLWAVQYQGTMSGNSASVEVVHQSSDPNRPEISLELTLTAEDAMNAGIQGDDGFPAQVTIVRAGPRCRAD